MANSKPAHWELIALFCVALKLYLILHMPRMINLHVSGQASVQARLVESLCLKGIATTAIMQRLPGLAPLHDWAAFLAMPVNGTSDSQ